ncbi:MAG: hypothetical protein CMK07_00735 [Ponticaulis sp.]|nr:hypothetical protein [Ponticaulis sp.]
MRALLIAGLAVMCGPFAAEAENRQFPAYGDEPLLLTHGLLAQQIYTDYKAWLDRKITRAVQDRAESQALIDKMDFLSVEVHGLSWWTNGDSELDYFAGGIGFVCRNGDEDTMGIFSLSTPEEVQKNCDWKLWQMELDPENDVLNQLAGPSFKINAAADWVVSEKRITIQDLGEAMVVDWGDFPQLGDVRLLDEAIRQVTWSSRSCPGILKLINGLEGKEVPSIDIKKIGLDAEIRPYEAGPVFGGVKIASMNGVEVSYDYSTEEAKALLPRIEAIRLNCAPDA